MCVNRYNTKSLYSFDIGAMPACLPDCQPLLSGCHNCTLFCFTQDWFCFLSHWRCAMRNWIVRWSIDRSIDVNALELWIYSRKILARLSLNIYKRNTVNNSVEMWRLISFQYIHTCMQLFGLFVFWFYLRGHSFYQHRWFIPISCDYNECACTADWSVHS